MGGDVKADVKRKVKKGRDLPEVAGQERASDNTRSSNHNVARISCALTKAGHRSRPPCALTGTVPSPSLPTVLCGCSQA